MSGADAFRKTLSAGPFSDEASGEHALLNRALMSISLRHLFIVSCVSLVAAAGCGGSSSPTGPSTSSGATITGTVNGGNMSLTSASTGSAGLTAAAAPSGMVVTVTG